MEECDDMPNVENVDLYLEVIFPLYRDHNVDLEFSCGCCDNVKSYWYLYSMIEYIYLSSIPENYLEQISL